jgi:hypothetical protein
LGPKLFWPYAKAILALESWIGTHGAILGMEESQIAPSIANMAPQTKTTFTYGFVLAAYKGAAFDQHIGPL